jgi:hypothetical protein
MGAKPRKALARSTTACLAGKRQITSAAPNGKPTAGAAVAEKLIIRQGGDMPELAHIEVVPSASYCDSLIFGATSERGIGIEATVGAVPRGSFGK